MGGTGLKFKKIHNHQSEEKECFRYKCDFLINEKEFLPCFAAKVGIFCELQYFNLLNR